MTPRLAPPTRPLTSLRSLFLAMAAAVVLLGFSVSRLSAAETAEAEASSDARPILTPRPGPAPRINGPRLFGVRLGRPFIYRVNSRGHPFNLRWIWEASRGTSG